MTLDAGPMMAATWGCCPASRRPGELLTWDRFASGRFPAPVPWRDGAKCIFILQSACFMLGDLLQQELHKPGNSGAEEARRSSLVMPMVVVYAFGIEVALKALIIDGGAHRLSVAHTPLACEETTWYVYRTKADRCSTKGGYDALYTVPSDSRSRHVAIRLPNGRRVPCSATERGRPPSLIV